jgi:integrase
MARGSIRRRGATWTVTVDVGQVQGKRKQLTKGGFTTKREAQAWRDEQAVRLAKGEYVAPSRLTYGAFLDTWLAGIRNTIRPATFESYERMLRIHVVPRLGHIPLQGLGPERLNALYSELLQGGRLSPRSVQYVHVIIHRSLRDAVRWGKVTRNVSDMADPPKGKSNRNMATWTGKELFAFLGQLQGDTLHAPILLAATTGMRRGEVLGLRWSDVDLDQGRVTVRQTMTAIRDVDTGRHVIVTGEPKTAKSRRSVPLPAQTVAALRAHRKVQAQQRLMAGPGWTDHGLVFGEPNGQPIHPDRFRERFEYRVAKSKLPRIRFHDLRHTYATLALQAGVHAKVVSEILGHSSIGITLDVYSHAIPSMLEDAADTVAARIFGGA